MANTQFGFVMKMPTSPKPFGNSVDFTGASGITNIASTSSNKWCTTGNIVALYLDSMGRLQFTECSLTYFSSGGTQSQGWYFWTGYNGSGTYHPLGVAPTGHSITLQLLYNTSSNQWSATYTDHTQGTSLTYTISGTANVTTNGLAGTHIMFENGGDVTCSDYSTFGGLTFSNMTYYDSSGNAISFTSSSIGLVTNNLPNTCPSSLACLNQNQTNLSITRNC